MSKTEKKVGILNFHFAQNNYGAVMVGYALSKVVGKLGYSPHIINFVPPFLSTEPSVFEDFRKKYLPLTGIYRSWNELKESANDPFDTFIVGSDQVWRWHYNFIYALGWVTGCKNFIAYAASFGLPDVSFTRREMNVFRSCIKRFDSISVREESGVQICRDRFGMNAFFALDPTLLLDAEDYSEITEDGGEEIPDKTEDYVAYIVLDEKEHNGIHDPSLMLDIKDKYPLVNAMLNADGNFRPFRDWLRIIKNAKYVISSSFHGCVFSIIFKKQFVAIETDLRGNDRIVSLLSSLGVGNRLFRDCSLISLSSFERDIDYEIVGAKIREKKSASMQFLTEALARPLSPKKDVACVINFGRILGIPILEVRKACTTYLSLFGIIPLIRLRFGHPVSKVKAYFLGIIPLFSKKSLY